MQPGRRKMPRASRGQCEGRRYAPLQNTVRFAACRVRSSGAPRGPRSRRGARPIRPAGDLDQRHADAARAAAGPRDESVLHTGGSRGRRTASHRAPQQPQPPARRRRQRQRGIRRLRLQARLDPANLSHRRSSRRPDPASSRSREAARFEREQPRLIRDDEPVGPVHHAKPHATCSRPATTTGIRSSRRRTT